MHDIQNLLCFSENWSKKFGKKLTISNEKVSVMGLQNKHSCLKLFLSMDSHYTTDGSILAHFLWGYLIWKFTHSFSRVHNGNPQHASVAEEVPNQTSQANSQLRNQGLT